jgi:DNA-binding transcriptional ArsR family regulator
MEGALRPPLPTPTEPAVTQLKGDILTLPGMGTFSCCVDISENTIANRIHILYSRYMETIDAINALSALAQATRLDTFRLLVSREPEGVAAGELARLVAIPQNTMSTHLAILARAGLVRGERHSRSIIYRADLERFREVTLYLLKDCCGGRPELCAPLIADLTPCCPPKEATHG